MSQIGLVVILKIAKLAGDEGAATGATVPGPAIFNNAYLIFMMAHGIIAVSIITALMPRMSAAAAERRHDDLVHQLSLGTRLIAVVLVPATVAYALFGRPLAITLFQWGQYTHDQAVATGWVIAVAGLGLVPFAVSQLQIFAFYAMPDTRTPALANLPVVGVRIAVDVLLYVVFPVVWVAAGLMFGNAVSFVLAGVPWVLVAAPAHRPARSHPGVRDHRSPQPCRADRRGPRGPRPHRIERGLPGSGKLASLVQLAAGGLTFIGGYVIAALLLRVHEVRELTSMVRARVGR